MTNNEEDRSKKIRRLLDSEAETRAETPIEPRKDESEEQQATTKASVPRKTPTPPPYGEGGHISLDENNMPLPRRVHEVDLEGTRVSPVAYEPASRPRGMTETRRVSPPSQPRKTQSASFDWNSIDWKRAGGCLARISVLALFGVVILAIIGGSALIYTYYSIARTLPSVDDLKNRASQFETTRILDRNGNLLYEILDPTAGRRTYVTLDRISPALVAATIATEDKDFYDHPGFDVWAIVRALWENYQTDGQGGGASTITQQLARALLLSPEERAQRTYQRKMREIILAAEITRRYSKDEILELYLNEIYYGNLAYGIEAAAETYFSKTANQLTLAEASFLAGLPQSPSVYDIYTNRDVTLARQQQVLVLMFGLSQQRGCIAVSNSETPICVDQVAAVQAADDIKSRNFVVPSINAKYPHWVNFVRSELEKQYDAQTIYRSGFIVYTTIDPTLQNEAQRLVTEQLATLTDKNAKNGALVAIKPSTGEILAMVGSPDFNNDAIAGQINMADSATRQPGSSIKPITYVAAFEKGWTPSTLIWDVPTDFPDGANPPYSPVNYDGKFHGPMTVRTALSNSFNIPAVKALEFVGVYDNPNTPEKDGMIAMAERLGITSLTGNQYGLALTLGGGEVSLLNMTSAFSVFANGGVKVPPVAILKIVDFEGNVIYEYEPPQGEQVIRPEHAFLISSILSDNQARSWMFGPNSVLNLPFQVAAKTGTAGDPRGADGVNVYDNWTLGYTPDLATGVWVGNADYTPMINTSGTTGAAPIWSQFMTFAVPVVSPNNTPRPFTIPPGITERIICAVSGAEPSKWCKGGQRSEFYASDQLPLPASQDLLRQTEIDTWTGLIAGNACPDFDKEELVMNVKDEWARKWLRTGDGRDWLESHDMPRNPFFAPDRECSADDPRPILEFSNLNDNDVITETKLVIKGVIDVTKGDFTGWRLEVGAGDDPDDWTTLAQGANKIESNGEIFTWDLKDVTNNKITLRIYLLNGEEFYAEKRITLTLDLPTPTPEPTATPSITPLPPTDAPTATPSETPTPTPPTETPTPSATPTGP
ncbi:MAG: Monofunctional biosynthetic peptidoglycan transglycosylase [Anaerolineales bacterium]|nr:Monofunctional biosynthetic peptidoglycan transglycosylase [Anaerolineales bacterium]